MARITPAEDFKAMFTNLFDYKFNGRFIGNLEQTYVFNSDFDTFGKSIEIIENRVKKCNCRWTCDWYAGGNQGNCTITDSGCGFMWAFECTGYVGP